MNDPAVRTAGAVDGMSAVPTLAHVGADVEWGDVEAAAAARDHVTAGAGRLLELREWLAATQGRWPPRVPTAPRLITLGTPPDGVAATADTLGVRIRTVDLPGDATDAVAVGVAAADEQIESGTDLIVVAGADDGAAGVVVSVLTDTEPVALLPRGPHAVDSAAWIVAAERLRDARRRAAALRGLPDDLLAQTSSAALGVCAGMIMRAAARRTAVVLDGTVAVTAALLCRQSQARAARWWLVADTAIDPVHTRAVAELDQRPLLDLATSGGDGLAGLLCLPLLRAAAELGEAEVS